jgi:hypothetical protein
MMLENLDNRESESVKEITFANELASQLPYWSPKLINVITAEPNFSNN